MIALSIIIPVYNAEKDLKKCLESVLNNGFDKKFEIICINDGSTDSSGDILDHYSYKHKSIHIIHQKNNGVSVARNKGLEISQGKYVLFLDADDYLDTEKLLEVYKKATSYNLDLVITSYLKNDGQKINVKLPANTVLMEDCKVKYFKNLNTDNVLPYSWRNLYKREFLVCNRIVFNKKIKYGEDSLFNLESLVKANTVMYLDLPFYHYIFKSTGTMGSSKDEFITNLNTLFSEKLKIYDKYLPDKYKEDLYKYTLTHTLALIVSDIAKKKSGSIYMDTKSLIQSEMMIVSLDNYQGNLFKLESPMIFKITAGLINIKSRTLLYLYLYIINKKHKYFAR